MSKLIYKYELNGNVNQTNISMPKGSDILDIQLQFKTPVIWVLVNAEEQIFENRRFMIYPTGVTCNQPIEDYIATYQEGGYVWHVFEVKGDE